MARVCKGLNTKLVLWFSDTGLEYPEVREHVKNFPKYLEDKYGIEVELVMDYPKDKKTGKRITFKDVIFTHGYPIISKEVSLKIKETRSKPNGYASQSFDSNSPKILKYGSRYDLSKWKFLLDAPFKISNNCCDEMKKKPSKQYEKESRRKVIIGTMAEESQARKTAWKAHGCNAFDGKRPSSQPLSFWTEQDVLQYIVQFKLPIPSVYGEILKDDKGMYYTTRCNRTGCVFCAYGGHLEKEPNRFQRLKQTHPKLWNYCMKPVDEGGLGMKEVLEFIGVKIE